MKKLPALALALVMLLSFAFAEEEAAFPDYLVDNVAHLLYSLDCTCENLTAGKDLSTDRMNLQLHLQNVYVSADFDKSTDELLTALVQESNAQPKLVSDGTGRYASGVILNDAASLTCLLQEDAMLYMWKGASGVADWSDFVDRMVRTILAVAG